MRYASAMRSPRFWLWLHRLGYVTTALMVLELLAIGGGLIYGQFAGYRQLQQERAATRTVEGPLTSNPDSYILFPDAPPPFAGLPPLVALSGDGIRATIQPSFGLAHYRVAMWQPAGAGPAQGVLIIEHRGDERGVDRRPFALPRATYADVLAKIDHWAANWPGSGGDYCCDGTAIGFERVSGPRVLSGSGNCSDHYDALKRLLLQIVRRYAAGKDLPTEDDWTLYPPAPGTGQAPATG